MERQFKLLSSPCVVAVVEHRGIPAAAGLAILAGAQREILDAQLESLAYVREKPGRAATSVAVSMKPCTAALR